MPNPILDRPTITDASSITSDVYAQCVSSSIELRSNTLQVVVLNVSIAGEFEDQASSMWLNVDRVAVCVALGGAGAVRFGPMSESGYEYSIGRKGFDTYEAISLWRVRRGWL